MRYFISRTYKLTIHKKKLIVRINANLYITFTAQNHLPTQCQHYK